MATCEQGLMSFRPLALLLRISKNIYLSDSVLTLHVADRQRLEDHEELVTHERKGVEGSQGMRAGMRLRIHLLHCALARIPLAIPVPPTESSPLTGVACILHFWRLWIAASCGHQAPTRAEPR